MSVHMGPGKDAYDTPTIVHTPPIDDRDLTMRFAPTYMGVVVVIPGDWNVTPYAITQGEYPTGVNRHVARALLQHALDTLDAQEES
jgi:hypothetical protein